MMWLHSSPKMLSEGSYIDPMKYFWIMAEGENRICERGPRSRAYISIMQAACSSICKCDQGKRIRAYFLVLPHLYPDTPVPSAPGSPRRWLQHPGHLPTYLPTTTEVQLLPLSPGLLPLYPQYSMLFGYTQSFSFCGCHNGTTGFFSWRWSSTLPLLHCLRLLSSPALGDIYFT